MGSRPEEHWGTSRDAIADGLRRFLALDEARRGAMRAAARSRALADFSLAAMVARTCAVWERVLAR